MTTQILRHQAGSAVADQAATPERVEFSLTRFKDEEAPQLAADVRDITGVYQAAVNRISERVTIEFDPSLITPEQLGYLFEADVGVRVRALVRWHSRVDGSACVSCAHSIEQAIETIAGVRAATVNLATHDITVEYAWRRTDRVKLREALEGKHGGCS